MDECRRLAREGEKATRIGDAAKGIELLESALAVGIDDINDLPLLSAIYSQLGNAYYAQKQYKKALTFHGNDLMLSRVQKDSVQQAKAYSNMSATYTMLHEVDQNFEQAMTCANNVICLAKKLNDKGLECRGLYNLGLAHLQNAIQGGNNGLEATEEILSHLQEAVKCFERHLEIAKERKDEILCGLAIGNLGNAYFYLGNYEQSIIYHLKRLEMARAVGDKSSMRRSYTNMANAYVLLGNHDEAAKCYRKALALAQETNRKNLEAQLLFSLGNVESLRKNHKEAVSNYLKHLRLARAFSDNAGEARANSSLANALVQLNDIPKALYFLVVKYKLAEKLADESMKRSTLEEIKKLIKFNPSAIVNTEDDRICLDASFDPDNLVDDSEMMDFDSIGDSSVPRNHLLVPTSESGLNNSASAAALSMPNLSLSLSLESFIRECARGSSSTPKKGSLIPLSSTGGVLPTPKNDGSHPGDASFLMSTDCGLNRVSAMCKSMPHIETNEEDDFFNCLMRVQGNRINEQRADAGILKDRTNNEDMRQSDNVNMRDMSGHGLHSSRESQVRRVVHRRREKRRTVQRSIPKGARNSCKGAKARHNSGLVHKVQGARQRRKEKEAKHQVAGNSSSSSSNRRVSLGAAHLVKSMGSQFHKSVIKPFSSSSLLHRSNRPHSFYDTLPADSNNTSSSSSKSKTKTKRNKLTKCKSVAQVPEVKEEEPENSKSPVFRVPHLPVQKGGKSVQMAPSPQLLQTTPYSCSTISSSPSLRKWHKEMAGGGGKDQHNPETILDLIEAIQSRRMDEQRADLVVLPGLNNPKQLLEKFNLGVHRHSDADGGNESLEGDELVDERLYELIVQSQADRLEDQRSELGGRQPQQQQQHKKRPSNCSSTNDDDFVDDGGVCLLVERMQVGRINEQRAHFSPSQVEDDNMENNSPNSRNNSPSIALA